MVLGITWFRCPKCGNEFRALKLKAKDGRTKERRCPRCGTHSPESPMRVLAEDINSRIGI